MIFTTLALCLPAPEVVRAPAVTLEAEAVPTARFDRKWILPQERTDGGRDLIREMRDLAGLEFEIEGPGGVTLRCLGDLYQELRKQPVGKRRAWFEELKRGGSKFVRDWNQGLSELLLDDKVMGTRWSPSEDEPNDGMLIAENWDLSKVSTGPWSGIKVKPRLEQAAVMIFSDLASIKRAENDYRTYPSNIGSDYEAIYPLANSHYRGTTAGGAPYSGLTLYFCCDLPWPYSDYKCELRILNEVGSRGETLTHIYSTSEDFYWLAGRDVFLPIDASDGERMGYLLVRQFGFDLFDVPDKPKHRVEALRGSLGNLKRRAEALFRNVGAELAADEPPLPEFDVLGIK